MSSRPRPSVLAAFDPLMAPQHPLSTDAGADENSLRGLVIRPSSTRKKRHLVDISGPAADNAFNSQSYTKSTSSRATRFNQNRHGEGVDMRVSKRRRVQKPPIEDTTKTPKKGSVSSLDAIIDAINASGVSFAEPPKQPPTLHDIIGDIIPTHNPTAKLSPVAETSMTSDTPEVVAKNIEQYPAADLGKFYEQIQLLPSTDHSREDISLHMENWIIEGDEEPKKETGPPFSHSRPPSLVEAVADTNPATSSSNSNNSSGSQTVVTANVMENVATNESVEVKGKPLTTVATEKRSEGASGIVTPVGRRPKQVTAPPPVQALRIIKKSARLNQQSGTRTLNVNPLSLPLHTNSNKPSTTRDPPRGASSRPTEAEVKSNPTNPLARTRAESNPTPAYPPGATSNRHVVPNPRAAPINGNGPRRVVAVDNAAPSNKAAAHSRTQGEGTSTARPTLRTVATRSSNRVNSALPRPTRPPVSQRPKSKVVTGAVRGGQRV